MVISEWSAIVPCARIVDDQADRFELVDVSPTCRYLVCGQSKFIDLRGYRRLPCNYVQPGGSTFGAWIERGEMHNLSIVLVHSHPGSRGRARLRMPQRVFPLRAGF